jgi:hypothetical protein
VRRSIFGLTIALLGAGCTPPPSIDASIVAQPITIQASASPFTQITAGEVRAMVPDGWEAVPATDADDARSGFLASPRPEALRRMDGSIAGMSATWIDATRVGVPTDFYYLAATGPVLSRLTHSNACRPERQRVLVDNRPTFGVGAPADGDYMAQGQGTCNVRGTPTRWAYFVAAPGFGPVRRVGIPTSGLYVVVAVMRDSERAREVLPHLIRHTSFGGDSVPDLMNAIGSKRAR